MKDEDRYRSGEAAAGPLGVWEAGRLLAKALAEQRQCLRAVYGVAAEVVRPPEDAPEAYAVRLGKVPEGFYAARKNLFSTLFYAVYLALGVSRPRRLLYGQLNHLFRMWVTGADNLLDGEDKCVLPLQMPGRSRVMREVVVLMAADRILWRLLRAAERDGTLTARQADALADGTLRCLLPSAAQEGSEEGGVTQRPEPGQVLDTIHVLKTGLLFKIPFLGLDLVEETVDVRRADRLKRALMAFGGGCQILDDIRDLGRDFVERRHNYLLSVLARERPGQLQEWSRRGVRPGDRLYFDVLAESLSAARLGYQRLVEACRILQEERILVPGFPVARLACTMFTVLDLEDLSHVCSFL